MQLVHVLGRMFGQLLICNLYQCSIYYINSVRESVVLSILIPYFTSYMYLELKVIGSDQPSLVDQVLHYSLTHRLILLASHGIIEHLDE